MPPLGPIKRRELIRRLRDLGFDGPYSGGNHQFMARGSRKLRIPNPHQNDISLPLLRRILDQAGITVEEWQSLS
jgi:predicted RNA binding protein YcfA (HicA-like mRNA interferase family)